MLTLHGDFGHEPRMANDEDGTITVQHLSGRDVLLRRPNLSRRGVEGTSEQ